MASNNGDNPLLQPPFVQIAGIAPTAPISAQVEQIDQLNTLLLQEIDANFARFHQVVTSRVLPDVKRFAIGGEPVREASQFWRSFFEAAAAVKVPLPGDSSTITPSTDNSRQTYDDEEEEDDRTVRQDDSLLSNDAAEGDGEGEENGTFILDQHATSSTPHGPHGRQGGSSKSRKRGGDESWDDSMDSPFDKFDRQLERFGQEGGGAGESSSEIPTPSLPSGFSGYGAEDGSYGDASTGTVEPADLPHHSTQQVGNKGKGRENGHVQAAGGTPKGKSTRNSMDPSRKDWNGIADLRSTPLNAKFHQPRVSRQSNQAQIGPGLLVAGGSKKTSQAPPRSSLAQTLADMSMEDSDDDALPMSPPVTMTWNLPPRAQAVFNAGKTPVKTGSKSTANGAKRILDDLFEEMGGEYQPSPRMPTPEGLGRYSMMPSDFGPGKQLFNPSNDNGLAGGNGGAGGSRPSRVSQGAHTRRSMANTSFGSDILDEEHPQPTPITEEDSLEMEDDSFDSAFGGPTHQLQLNHNDREVDLLGDETFMSSPDRGPGYPGGMRDDGMTGRSEAGMIFGGRPSMVPLLPSQGLGPGQRKSSTGLGQQTQQARGSNGMTGQGGAGGRTSDGQGQKGAFELYKTDEMMTYHGGRLEDAAGRELKHSPLAAARGGMGKDLVEEGRRGSSIPGLKR